MEKMRKQSKKIMQQSHGISLNRQVQFIQAILILVGIILGSSFSQWCYMLAVISGISLLVASLTGECLLVKLFAKFPWNDVADKY